jgi:hypothetical protein
MLGEPVDNRHGFDSPMKKGATTAPSSRFFVAKLWWPVGGLQALPVPFFRSVNPLVASPFDSGWRNATKKGSNTMYTNQQTQQAKRHTITGAACVSNVIRELWERASDGLSEEELEWFSDSGEQAEFLLGLLTDTANKVGCLIAADENAGPYKDQASVAGLLFFLTECMSAANALASVSTEASYKLHRKNVIEVNARASELSRSTPTFRWR